MTIQCKNIKKFYGEKENRIEALKGIDLEIHPGQLTLLVGPSGSGKTTLLSILHTILTPDEGDLIILGCPINKLNELEKAQFRSQHLGVIFQGLYLVPTLTVLENVILPVIIRGGNQQDAKEEAAAILNELKIADRMDASPVHLSRGQQQRVAIARALINDPQIIMCDEPTSALDQTAGFEFMSILRSLALEDKRTVFVVTHDHRIFPFANRIVSIRDGIVEEEYA